jgi:hypothetical protein
MALGGLPAEACVLNRWYPGARVRATQRLTWRGCHPAWGLAAFFWQGHHVSPVVGHAQLASALTHLRRPACSEWWSRLSEHSAGQRERGEK